MVEIMIASTILVAVIGMTVTFFLSALDIYGISVGKLNVNGEVRHFSEVFTRDTARACKIAVAADGSSITLTYRDSSGDLTGAVDYTYSSTTGIVTRTDQKTHATAVVVRGIRPRTSGGKLFNALNTTSGVPSTVYITGYIDANAQARTQRTVQNIVEFAATRHG